MALFSRIHILHTSMDRLKEVSIMVCWFHLSVLINSIFRKIQGESKGEHELSRKSHKEHLIYHQQYVILQPHKFAFQPLLLLIFSSMLSLHSHTILFGFWMHKKIWTKANFSLTSFHILCKISDKGSRKPIVQAVLWVTIQLTLNCYLNFVTL